MKKSPGRLDFALRSGFTVAALTVAAVPAASGKPPALARVSSVVMLDRAGLNAKLGLFEEGRWIAKENGDFACDVQVYRFEYLTVDGVGRPATASAALMVPRGQAAKCRGPVPAVLALHGTTPDRYYNLADFSGSNSASPRAIAWAAIYAAQGYVVVAPNYVGFDNSSSDYHPYFDNRQQTRDAIDAYDTARGLLGQTGTRHSGKLFITGYSQGGWLAMATHRAMEQQGRAVTASVPGSGPYAPIALMDDVFLGRPVQGSTMYVPLAITAAQRAGAHIYRDPADFYGPRYAKSAEGSLPSRQPWAELVGSGILPASKLFASPFPDLPDKASPALKALSALAGPELGPAALRPMSRTGIGSEPLIGEPARLAYLEDMAAHPDRAYPNWTTGRPATGARNPFRKWLLTADLRGWTPRAPMTMCGGDSDAAAPFRFGGELMMRHWSSPGTRAPAGRVSLINFDAPAAPGEPWAPLKANLAAMRGQIVAAKGEDAWVELYHQYTLPRYCYTAARMWFDTMR